LTEGAKAEIYTVAFTQNRRFAMETTVVNTFHVWKVMPNSVAKILLLF
jgi:hypothetical protein